MIPGALGSKLSHHQIVVEIDFLWRALLRSLCRQFLSIKLLFRSCFFGRHLKTRFFFLSSALFHSASLHKRCKKTVQTAFEDNLCFISAPHYRSATWLSDLQWTFWEPWTPWFLFLPHTPRHHRHLMTSQSEIRQLVAATLQRNCRRISWPLLNLKPQRCSKALSSSQLETNPRHHNAPI